MFALVNAGSSIRFARGRRSWRGAPARGDPRAGGRRRTRTAAEEWLQRAGRCYLEGCPSSPAGDGISVDGVRFADDEDDDKLKALQMLRLVRRLNGELLPALPLRDQPPVDVTCFTCHRGAARPQSIESVLALTIRMGAGQIDAQRLVIPSVGLHFTTWWYYNTNMIRTQIQLTEEQYQRLKRWANARNISLAEAIRRCVSEQLAVDESTPSRAQLIREALAVAGAHRDPEGTRDVARDHDRYLSEAYRG